uniref:Lin-15A/B-like domain-containing protein n=1 Tax=Caenorhabditis japonica TaxID=281687 RepID=A0A8R1HLZ6_CAEJA
MDLPASVKSESPEALGSETDPKNRTEPRGREAIDAFSRFMTAQGAPFEEIEDVSYQELVEFLNSDLLVPHAKSLSPTGKEVRIDHRSAGPMSVTFDFCGSEDEEKMLVFSVHYFNYNSQRQNLVFLRKVMTSDLTIECFIDNLREALGPSLPHTYRFENLMTPSLLSTQMFHGSANFKNGYVCFQYYMTKFVNEVLEIDEIAESLGAFRTIIRYIKRNYRLCKEFKEMQLSTKQDYTLPITEKRGSWQSTARFLAKALSLVDVFNLLRFRQSNFTLPTFLRETQLQQLTYVHHLLKECIKHSRELASPLSSISQVIPAVMSLRNYISKRPSGHPFDRNIRTSYTSVFQELTFGEISQRFDIACLLDPRFGYSEDVYPTDIWMQIERKVIEEFSYGCKIYTEEIRKAKKQELFMTLEKEFRLYRTMIAFYRPNQISSPFDWWASHRTELKNLARTARAYLVCPAVAIDSGFYFGEGGKFNHLINCYSSQRLDNFLKAAGCHQTFRGKGAVLDDFDPNNLEEDDPAPPKEKRPRFALPLPLEEPSTSNSPGSSLQPLKEPKNETIISSDEFPIVTKWVKKQVKFEIEDPEDVQAVEVKKEIEDADFFKAAKLGNLPSTSTEEKTGDEKPQESSDKESESDKLEEQSCEIAEVCSLCNNSAIRYNLKPVRHDQNKLLLLAATVIREEMDVQAAIKYFNVEATRLACQFHYLEACDDILSLLAIKDPCQLVIVTENRIMKLAPICTRISGQNLDVPLLRQIIEKFLKLNYEKKEKFSNAKLACCFCGQLKKRSHLIKLPRKLEDVGEYVNPICPKGINLICRCHFPENAISSRGRIYKDLFPQMNARAKGAKLTKNN